MPRDAQTLWCLLMGLCSLACSGVPSAETSPAGQGPAVTATSQPANLPYFNTSDFTPRWLAPSEVPTDFHRIPAFSMHNQRGEVITEAAMDGTVTVVDFFFASCSGICPRLAESMLEIDAAFDDDAPLALLSYTVMPENDTIEVLAAYAESHKLTSPRWHLLTGDRSETYALGRRSYFIEESMGETRDDSEFLHTENLVLLDKHRRIRGVYSGTNRAATAQLIADARRLVAEE